MAFFDAINQIIHCNVMYCGPAMSGKTASIRQIARYHTEQQRLIHPIQHYATEAFRFISCSVLGQQQIGDWQLHLHCLGQQGVAMEHTFTNEWISIADAVVFVVDSQHDKLQSNIIALKNVAKMQQQNQRTFRKLPFVLQYNKRDMSHIIPIETLQRFLNPLDWEYVETNAYQGSTEAIVAALNTLETRLITYLKQDVLQSLARFIRLTE
ncbi:GTPase domain-containing protein [Herpetosiphon gulosus]|uniref:Gliding-motility protein MglA n=1 Tax=Herpetosiphon gulosus TaxID=1973496 RepID=A0ABP9X247_9CHLR